MKLAVVVLSYNTKKLLGQCLLSLGKCRRKGFDLEIIVVDNGSTDGTVEFLREWQKKNKSSCLFNKENLGFAAGNNVGIRWAIAGGAEQVMVLNSDTLVDRNFFVSLAPRLKEKPEIGVWGPKIYFAAGHEFHKKRYRKEERGKVIWSVGGEIDWRNMVACNRGVDEVDNGQYNQEKEVDFVSGCCLLASAATWRKVNFFDERYFLYYEDADFCQRVKRLGGKIIYFPKSRIWHVNAGSSECGGDLQDYFISRNRLLFGMKWAPLKTKVSLVKESWQILRRGRNWQKCGVKDFYLRRFGKGSWQ